MLEKALWIGCSEDMGTVCPEFSRKFVVKKKLKKAELTITAIGVYEAVLNGKRIGDFILAPGCTSYRTRLQCQTYDVTALCMQEKNCTQKENCTHENELSVTVGTGWHRGRITQKDTEMNAMPCSIIGQLVLEYADGSLEEIVTDERWLVGKTPILFSDFYDGEIYDAAAPCGEKKPVKVLDLPRERLISQEGEIIREKERIRPVKLLVSPKGERILDFGQNFAGYPQFRLFAPKGARVRISFAEILDKDGNFYTENYRTAKAELVYICKEGEQTYKPHLTFYGFRYIRLDEYPGQVKPEDFTGIALYSDMKRTGYLACANEKLNRFFENVLWSQRANFIDIPTDCPQRDERMGWTGDAQVFAKAACYNYDAERFFAKWMRDVRADQREDGAVPDTVPNWKSKGCSAAWGDVITVIPWQVYQTYGNQEILEENFEAMKKWVDFMTKDSHDAFLWTDVPEKKTERNKHYGDWLGLDAPYGSYRGSTDQDFIASAFYAYSTLLVIKAGRALGKEVSDYERLYKRIKETFQAHFTDLKTQTEHVLALYFGLTSRWEETAANLAEMVRKNGNRLQTGFVGTPYLLYALSENGYVDTAYDLLLQEAYPSWLYEVNHGATTIWEHWDGVRDDGTIWSSAMNSYNHYAYGSVMDWVYTVAAGIRTKEDAPGFARAVIAPMPGKKMGWLDASLETRQGCIRSSWVCGEQETRYEIITPVKTLIIIDGQEHQVEPGSYVFFDNTAK